MPWDNVHTQTYVSGAKSRNDGNKPVSMLSCRSSSLQTATRPRTSRVSAAQTRPHTHLFELKPYPWEALHPPHSKPHHHATLTPGNHVLKTSETDKGVGQAPG